MSQDRRLLVTYSLLPHHLVVLAALSAAGDADVSIVLPDKIQGLGTCWLQTTTEPQWTKQFRVRPLIVARQLAVFCCLPRLAG